VPTPIFHFSAGIFKRHEPVGVQALCPELAVQALDESVVRGLAGPGEVERHPTLVGPQVEIPGDELRALVDPDHPGQPDLAADTFEHIDNIGSLEREPRLEGRREPRERIEDRQEIARIPPPNQASSARRRTRRINTKFISLALTSMSIDVFYNDSGIN
jgi:hypothetical protein